MYYRYRIQTIPFTVVIPAGQTVGTSTDLPTGVNDINGILSVVYVNAPVLTGTSWDLEIDNPGNAVLATYATNNPNKEVAFGPVVAVAGQITIKITSNATELAPRTFSGKLLIDRG